MATTPLLSLMAVASHPRAQSPKLPPTVVHKGSTDMNKIDFERAALLMDIQAKVATIGVMNTFIAGEAAQELKGINEACKANAGERAKAAHENEQLAAQQKLQAEPIDDKPEDSVEEHPEAPIIGRRV